MVKLVTDKPNSIIYASKQLLQKLVDRPCLQVLSRRIQANDSRTAVMGHDIRSEERRVGKECRL